MTSDPGKKTSGIYSLYRKLRFLQYRGTLFHKEPRFARKKDRLRIRRKFFRFFRFLKFRSNSRLGRIQAFRYEQEKSSSPGYLLVSGKTVVGGVTPIPVLRKIPFAERKLRFWRILRFVFLKRKLKRKKRKAEKSRIIKGSTIWYRKFRYLYNTGQLFKINKSELHAYYERNLGFIYKKNSLIISLNSTAIFLLAYLFIYLIRQFSIALVSSSFDIETIVYFFDVDFLIRGRDWGHDAVKVIFSIGPFVSLLLSLIALIAFANYQHKTSVFRLFIFWVFCFGFTGFFGELLMGSLMDKGIGFVILYLFFMDTGKMVIAFLSLIILIATGLFIKNYMLITGNIYYNYLVKRNRGKFVFNQIILPYLAGMLIIYLVKYPRMLTIELAVNLSMILLLLPAIIRSRFRNELFFDQDSRNIHLYGWWILAASLLFPIFRIILGIGVRI